MNRATTLLFVYGTLKRGLANHHLIADQEFRGDAVTEPRYRVLDLGAHPGLIVDESNGLAVMGELWAVNESCLAELDDFEEVPGSFVRERVEIRDRLDYVVAYYWHQPVPIGAASGSEWPLKQTPRE